MQMTDMKLVTAKVDLKGGGEKTFEVPSLSIRAADCAE